MPALRSSANGIKNRIVPSCRPITMAGFPASCTPMLRNQVESQSNVWNTVQSAPGWNQGTGPKTWIKYSFFAEVLRGSPGYGVRLVIQALLCLTFVIAIPFVFKRFGYGYAVYTTVILAIPLVGSSSFMGFGRYLLAAFPVFALGGEALAERTTPRRLVLGTSALGLLVLASFFGRGFYLS